MPKKLQKQVFGSQLKIINSNSKRGKQSIPVWEVELTDDISDNATLNTYYIDARTRKLLKHEIGFGGRKMIMRLKE